MLIFSCANGIREPSGLISVGTCCSECPLIWAQRFKRRQPSHGCVISPNTQCPWNMFSLFWEHRQDSEFITKPSPQMAELLIIEHSRWWSVYKDYKSSFYTLFFISAQKYRRCWLISVVESFKSYCRRCRQIRMSHHLLLCIICGCWTCMIIW